MNAGLKYILGVSTLTLTFFGAKAALQNSEFGSSVVPDIGAASRLNQNSNATIVSPSDKLAGITKAVNDAVNNGQLVFKDGASPQLGAQLIVNGVNRNDCSEVAVIQGAANAGVCENILALQK